MEIMQKSILITVSWLLSLFLLITTASAQEKGMESITLQLKWKHQFQFAGYYAAIHKGFFQDEGLDVALRVPKAGEDPAQLVATGTGEYGIGTSELVVSRNKGLPVVALAAVYQHSPYAIASLKSSSIKSVHDLAGKRIMLEPQAAEVWAYMRNEGIPTSTLQLEEHTFNTESLISGKVDAMTVYETDEPYTLEKKNIPYNLFSARSAGIDFYGDVLFTTQNEIDEHPERVAAFLRASRRGWHYALSHIKEVSGWIYEHYSQRKTVDQLLFEAKHGIALIRPDLVEWGYMSPGRWQHIAQTYHKLGMLSDDWSLKGFIYDPKPQTTDLSHLYQLLSMSLLALIVVAGIGGRFYVLSKRLHLEVQKRQEAETQAQQALEEERNLLAIMAHDFRGPINLISASSQLIEVSPCGTTPIATRELLKIKGAIQSLDTLINSCLTWDRMEGAYQGDYEDLELIPLIQEVVNNHQEMDPDRPIVTRYLDENIRIYGSPTLLAIALGNLLDNARKYGPIGAQIELKLHRVTDKVEIRVVDHGPGLPPDQLTQVFKKYYRSTPKTSGSGSGIGLNAVRQIAQAHQGTARAEAGSGGCFVITLPLKEEEV
ncbi:ABC transporter substrate-binding protein [Magnetococcus sp. PR-3]|uniref:ABC transporter substrate-binding protein n=1 Tax=Magnetococcus sp. PR-3 TaxID=3120355 RepID=UPI002FCE3920